VHLQNLDRRWLLVAAGADMRDDGQIRVDRCVAAGGDDEPPLEGAVSLVHPEIPPASATASASVRSAFHVHIEGLGLV